MSPKFLIFVIGAALLALAVYFVIQYLGITAPIRDQEDMGVPSALREECSSDRPACEPGTSAVCRRGRWYCR